MYIFGFIIIYMIFCTLVYWIEWDFEYTNWIIQVDGRLGNAKKLFFEILLPHSILKACCLNCKNNATKSAQRYFLYFLHYYTSINIACTFCIHILSFSRLCSNIIFDFWFQNFNVLILQTILIFKGFFRFVLLLLLQIFFSWPQICF